jgi:hypothetical protein
MIPDNFLLKLTTVTRTMPITTSIILKKTNLQEMFAALQNLGSTHQHGDMSIMPTSMHFAGYLAFMLPLYSFLEQATPRFR